MIKKILCIITAAVLAVNLSVFAEQNQEDTVQNDGLVPITDGNILFSGRWSDTEKGSKKCGFEGYVEISFTGTSIKAVAPLSGRAYVVIDGKEPVGSFNLSGKQKTLAKNLENGNHTLRLYAQAQQAFLEIGGFRIDKGASVLPAKRGKIIEFVGDSIMEGYVDPRDEGKWGANSYMNSYARLTGEMLNEKYGMSFNTIAFGGSGLLNVKTDPLPMSERYFKAIEMKSSDTAQTVVPDWDTSKYAPDYIVINMGTNDRGGNFGMFKATYLSFVRNLRKTYPDAEIVLMIPFKFYDDNQTGLINAIKQIVDESADEKIHLADTKDWNIPGGADNLHPSPDSHKKAANKLFEYMCELIGKAEPEPTATEPTATEPTATEPTATEPESTPIPTETDNSHGVNAALISVICGACLAAVIAAAVIIIKKRK